MVPGDTEEESRGSSKRQMMIFQRGVLGAQRREKSVTSEVISGFLGRKCGRERELK